MTEEKCVPLDMTDRNLTELNYPVLPNLVTHLYLNKNNLTYLPKDFFLQFCNLIWLDLRDNYLSDLPGELPGFR